MQIVCKNITRIETGPLQINDDWTGIFIRGDNAGALMLDISHIIQTLPPEYKRQHAFALHSLKSLHELLGSSSHHKTKQKDLSPNETGEIMRKEAFLPDGGNTTGCYSTFLVSPDYKKVKPTSKKYSEAINLLISRGSKIKKNKLKGEALKIYLDEFNEISQYDSVYYNKKKDILMAWFWDGDGTLVFKNGNDFYYNTDCKKDYNWEHVSLQ